MRPVPVCQAFFLAFFAAFFSFGVLAATFLPSLLLFCSLPMCAPRMPAASSNRLIRLHGTLSPVECIYLSRPEAFSLRLKHAGEPGQRYFLIQNLKQCGIWGRWSSPRTGRRYPSAFWRCAVPLYYRIPGMIWRLVISPIHASPP